MIITIDGPAGTGKSTIAKNVAKKLQITYFDTGALYRSIAWYVDKNNVPIDDLPSMEKLLKTFDFHIKREKNRCAYFVGKTDVTDFIRSAKISALASQIGAKGFVREALNPLQRDFAKTHDCVFEGRDLGTVVFPRADLKIFLSATPEIRAKRRLEQQTAEGQAKNANFEEILEQIIKRDKDDMERAVAPLKQAKDAFFIDTSNLNARQVTSKVLQCLKKKRTRKSICFQKNKASFFYRCVIFFYWCVFHLFYNFRVYGLEHSYSGGALIASNHVSFFDPPVLAVAYPDEVHIMARETLFRSFFGKCISKLNTHPVKGGATNLGVMKIMCSLLKEGKKVILFPEGTRPYKDELGEIKPGVGMLIARTETAVIPTYIHGNYKVWNRKHRFPKLSGSIACVFGSPILWESFKHMNKKEAQIAISKKLREAILALRKWYEEGAKGSPP